MALYYDGDADVTADFDDPVMLTLRRLDKVVAATGTTGVEDEVPSSTYQKLVWHFDACGVCSDGDMDGLSLLVRQPRQLRKLMLILVG